MRKRDMELDYLAPFLSRIGERKTLTREDALKIKEECLQDLKQRLIDKANLIQARFEKVERLKLSLIKWSFLLKYRSAFRWCSYCLQETGKELFGFTITSKGLSKHLMGRRGVFRTFTDLCSWVVWAFLSALGQDCDST